MGVSLGDVPPRGIGSEAAIHSESVWSPRSRGPKQKCQSRGLETKQKLAELQRSEDITERGQNSTRKDESYEERN